MNTQTSENKLIVSSSPHLRDKRTTSSVMRDVVIALIPAIVASGILFGTKALILIAVCIVSCVGFEYLWNLLMKKQQTVGDFTAVITGILLAFNLPATLPIWMAVIGCFVAIVVVKQLFGGLGQNFVNPAIGGRIVLALSFTSAMTAYPNACLLYTSTSSLASPDKLKGLDFLDVKAETTRILNLIDQNETDIDAIVCLAHCGWSTEEKYSSKAIAEAGAGKIDVIIDGHTHQDMLEGKSEKVGDTLIV